jgi:hypothetical protein
MAPAPATTGAHWTEAAHAEQGDVDAAVISSGDVFDLGPVQDLTGRSL